VDANPIRILCVDDNDLVLGALERKFAALPGFEWCGTLPDASGLLAQSQACRPHVVLLDLDMPGPDALSQVRELRRSLPQCRVLVLSGMLTEAIVERAVDAGAWGYVSKGEASGEIIDAVRRVAAGQFVLSREVQMVCTHPVARPRVT
jgi:DNA-binding NarL/FixJ family response regulator